MEDWTSLGQHKRKPEFPALAQSPGREAALAWASLAQRFPASSVLAREGAGCGSVGFQPQNREGERKGPWKGHLCWCLTWGVLSLAGKAVGLRGERTLQYSCLENPRDGGTWWAAVYGGAQSWT